MKSALAGLLAIPVIFALIAFSNTTQACAGGPPALTYVGENVTVPAHGYTVRSFEVKESSDSVYLSQVTGARLMVLTDPDMGNYTAGKSTTPLFDSANTSHHYHMLLQRGKYWAVLENKNGTEDIDVRVEIERPAMKGDCIAPEPHIGIMPGFDGAASILVLTLGAVLGVFIGKRK